MLLAAQELHGHHLAPRTFREVACAYFGLASPAVAPYGPLEIPCGGRAGPRVSDPHGVQLGLATLPGGDFDIRSAAIETVLHADMALAQLPQLQRQARRLFQGVVQPGARAHGRTALVPDLSAQLRFPDTSCMMDDMRRSSGCARVAQFYYYVVPNPS